MGLRFTVLASGSAGNAALVESGLTSACSSTRRHRTAHALAQRFLVAVGQSWASVNAVLLTQHPLRPLEGPYPRPPARAATCPALLPRPPSSYAAPLFGGVRRTRRGGSGPHIRGTWPVRAGRPGIHCRPLPIRHDLQGQRSAFALKAGGRPVRPGRRPGVRRRSRLLGRRGWSAASRRRGPAGQSSSTTTFIWSGSSGRSPMLIAASSATKGTCPTTRPPSWCGRCWHGRRPVACGIWSNCT